MQHRPQHPWNSRAAAMLTHCKKMDAQAWLNHEATTPRCHYTCKVDDLPRRSLFYCKAAVHTSTRLRQVPRDLGTLDAGAERIAVQDEEPERLAPASHPERNHVVVVPAAKEICTTQTHPELLALSCLLQCAQTCHAMCTSQANPSEETPKCVILQPRTATHDACTTKSRRTTGGRSSRGTRSSPPNGSCT